MVVGIIGGIEVGSDVVGSAVVESVIVGSAVVESVISVGGGDSVPGLVAGGGSVGDAGEI